MTVTFLTAFTWRRPLNGVTLATTIHKKLENVSDGTGTQVETQMINKCIIKMFQNELYNVRDPRRKRGGEKKQRKKTVAI